MDYQGFLNSIEKICVLVTITYFLSRSRIFFRLFAPVSGSRDKLFAFLFFSSLALTEVLLSPEKSPLNARIVAATAAGLLGGAWVGVGVGLFTSVVSLLTPGASMSWDGTAAAVGGILGGLVCAYTLDLKPKIVAGFMVGALSHMLWLGMVFWNDFLEAASWDALLVQYGVPVVASGTAVALFLIIIGDMRAQQERVERDELSRAISISNRILPKLGAGLNRESAAQIADTVRRLTKVAAVALTDKCELLAFCGVGEDHHSQYRGVAAAKCLAEALPKQLDSSAAALCDNHECRLSAVKAAPLFYDNRLIGCVEVYQTGGHKVNTDVVDLAVDITQFLCNYLMQLAELESKTQAISRAELKALQAQVHPHFLFNALNTIAALCELDPKKAGMLIVKLGDFFRSSLRTEHDLLRPLQEELKIVKSYLEIEKARFGDRLSVCENIEADAYGCMIPSFTIQPLVENAVLHGLAKKSGPGTLRIAARRKGHRLVCWVIDDGRGMDAGTLSGIDEAGEEAHALSMLRNRLRAIYGNNFNIRIRSHLGQGTLVCLWVTVTTEQAT